MAPSKASDAKATVRELVDKFVSRVRHNTEVHLETLATDLYKAFEDSDAKGKVDPKRAIVQIARAIGKAETGEPRADHFTRLLSAVRMLDEAVTLRAILEGLGRGAAMEATRVAVMVVEGEMLRAFSDFGFPAGQRPSDVALDSAPQLARAIVERLRVSVTKGKELPAFMHVAAGASGLAMPVTVGGEVVALIFAEGPDRAGEKGPAPAWTEHVEVLTRHAAARLEAVTSRRTVEVFSTTS
jgi:hypothetical protein